MGSFDFLKSVGNAMLDSVESDARKYSKDKRFSDEQREQYARVESGLRDLRRKSNSDDDDN